MAQISKGDTFTNGEQVTGARLNQLVDAAVLTVGAITDQPSIAAGTVASNDAVLLYDLSATALREANVSDILGSNLPITTSAIIAGTGSDITITPNDATIVSGVSYTSSDGLTVTVTSTAHTLAVGNVILVTLAGTGYNGTFRVATTLTNSFTYVMTTAATAGSGTLSYTKKGLVKNTSNKSIAGNLYVDGNLVVAGTGAFTNSLTAPTATALTNTTQVATTAFVRADNNVKAWVNFNGTGTVAIRASFNVTSITDNGVGDYTVNFTTALSDTNYAVTVSCGAASLNIKPFTFATGTCRIISMNTSGVQNDETTVNVAFIR